VDVVDDVDVVGARFGEMWVTVGAASVGRGVPMTERVAADTPIQIANVATAVAPTHAATESHTHLRCPRSFFGGLPSSWTSVTRSCLLAAVSRRHREVEPKVTAPGVDSGRPHPNRRAEAVVLDPRERGGDFGHRVLRSMGSRA
jgi:hypothetical protein